MLFPFDLHLSPHDKKYVFVLFEQFSDVLNVLNIKIDTFSFIRASCSI